MDLQINAKELRATLPKVVRQVRQGARITVIYRSRPAFRIVPLDLDEDGESLPALESDPIYQSSPLGHSRSGSSAAEHDLVLYTNEDTKR